MFSPAKKSSRLDRWTGRLRGAQGEDSLLARLKDRAVRLGLLTVAVTTLAATLIAFFWGQPPPYRAGEVCQYDLRARVYFDLLNQAQTERRREAAVAALPPDKRSDPEECERARQSVPPVVERYPPGAPLAQRGEPFSISQIAL